MRIGDYITVLRDGQITGQAMVRDIDTKWIVRPMIGSMPRISPRTAATRSARKPSAPRTSACRGRPEALAVDHVSLSVRAGEISVSDGLMGAGRSEFFDCVMGRHMHSTGKIFIDGVEVRERDTTRRIRRGLALIPEDRQREGLVQVLSIASNLTLASLGRFARFFHIDAGAEKKATRDMIHDLSIKAPNPDFEVTSMSGGNQQKVVIGKALMTDPESSSDGRAEPGHRRRSQGRRLPHHAQARRQGPRNPVFNFRPRGGHGAFRPHRRLEQRPVGRRLRQKRGDGGSHRRSIGQGTRTYKETRVMTADASSSFCRQAIERLCTS